MKKGLIGSLMVQQNYLQPEQLEYAQRIQRQQGGQLDEILIGTGMLTEAAYQQCLASMYGLVYLSRKALFSRAISASLLAKISYRMAMMHLILPIETKEEPARLLVAAQAPLKRDVKLGLMRESGVDEIEVFLSSREHLLDAIRHHYGAHMALRASQKMDQVTTSGAKPARQMESGEVNAFSLHREGFCPSCGVPYGHDSTSCSQCGQTQEEASLDPYINRVLGERWQLTRLISQGGMGLIYQATDLRENRQVAIKILRNQFRTSSLEIQRFHNEAKILQQLEHPNIVETFEFAYEDRLGFYLVMELLQGKDLYEYQFCMALPTSILCTIFIQVCEGMSHAHEQGIIHRDLKPENIFLLGGIERFHGVKIFDFGIGKLVHGQRRLTEPGIVMGTPEYIAPEQAKNADVDHRTDVYALSVIFYEFLVGRRLFEADNAFAYLMKHVYAAPDPIQEQCRREIPPELEQLIMRGLSKDPDTRIPSMEAFKEALLQIQVRLDRADEPEFAVTKPEPLTSVMTDPLLEEDTGIDEVVVGVTVVEASTRESQSSEQERIPTRPIVTSALALSSSGGVLPLPVMASAYAGVLRPFAASPPSSSSFYGEEYDDPASAPTTPEPLPEMLYEHATIPIQAILVPDEQAEARLWLWVLLGGAVLLSWFGWWLGMPK